MFDAFPSRSAHIYMGVNHLFSFLAAVERTQKLYSCVQLLSSVVPSWSARSLSPLGRSNLSRDSRASDMIGFLVLMRLMKIGLHAWLADGFVMSQISQDQPSDAGRW